MTSQNNFPGQLLRYAFLSASFLGSIGCAHALPPLKNSLNDNLISEPPDCAPDELRFTFQETAAPLLLGAQTKGIFNDDRDLVPLKWAGVMGRHAMLMAIPSNADAYKTWMSQFDSARHGSLAEKVKAVSAAIEKNFLYETDEATYGKSEYWATPIETIAKGQGDCEDLAILKYYALKYLDVPDSKLYITVVNTADDIPGGHITLFIEETASTPHAQVTLPLKDAEICMKDTEASGPAAPDFSNLKVSESYIKIKTPDSSPFPVRKSYVLYYAFNETGVWAIPANSGPLWGTPKHEPAVCVKIPAGAARTAPSSGKMR